ncbi:MAG: HAD hydrolase family protein, partial [Spirochaetales bacterium]|nr:HAD hydrolase family protein [Spirochaetales bacterium]
MWKNKKLQIIAVMKLNFFFDIDGTILPVGRHIPQSALDAFAKAKALGHRLFFCTGRSPFEITEELLAVADICPASVSACKHQKTFFCHAPGKMHPEELPLSAFAAV